MTQGGSHHHSHHHGHHHHNGWIWNRGWDWGWGWGQRRSTTVINCGDSPICNAFFIFIFLAIVIGFIVAAFKGAFSKKKEHYSNCNKLQNNKQQNSKN